MQPEDTPRVAFADGQFINASPFSDPPAQEDSWSCSSRRAHDQATRAAKARNRSGRRRFVDPTTCEREYDEDELQFMQAIQEYKHRSGRQFPTWSEVLEVLKGLGYEKVADGGSR